MLDRVSQALTVELPEAETMDEYIDSMLSKVRPWSEDLREEHFFLNKPWLEFRDDLKFHQAILHFFHVGGEYIRSVDGNYTTGEWRHLEGTNKMMLSMGGQNQLFDLAFLDNQFFILDKHGDQHRLGEPKYFVMLHEPVGKRLEWRDAMELLFNKYRNSSGFYITLGAIVLLIIILLVVMY